MSPALIYLAASFRTMLGIVFTLSSIAKARRSAEFARTVAAYRVLPGPVARSFALALIAIEGLLGLALMLGAWTEVALALTIALLSVFLAAVSTNLIRKRRILCGCFGTSSERISGRTVARLVLLLAVAVATRLVLGDAPGIEAPGPVDLPGESRLVALVATLPTAVLMLLAVTLLMHLHALAKSLPERTVQR